VCDLSPRAECVPTFTRESKRGPFVREVEKCAKIGLEQRRDGNFLTIFVGMGLDEKPNFLSWIFG
jgi:hypothetical protein